MLMVGLRNAKRCTEPIGDCRLPNAN